jgi:hypothetical protein
MPRLACRIEEFQDVEAKVETSEGVDSSFSLKTWAD